MDEQKYLVFDFGASNGRAVVAFFDGSKFRMELSHRFDNRPVLVRGTLYWDILRLFSELKFGIQTSLKKYGSFCSLGLDTWGADFGLLDSNGKLLSNPINYRDQQSTMDSESLFGIIPQRELFELTGALCTPIYDLFHMYSLKVNSSTILNNAATYLSIADLFNYFLTGEKLIELTRFTTSVQYNQKEGKIEKSIFERLDLPGDIFPGFIYPGQKIGDISKEVSSELGTGQLPVIVPSTHDTASAVAGIPIGDSSKNWAFLSLGTWACMGVENDEVLISDDIFDSVFANEAGVEDTNIFVKNINGLWVIQQCREKWLKDNDISWDQIVELSKKAGAFRSFIDVDQQQFYHPNFDMPEIIRDYCIKTGQLAPSSIGEIARCAYESLALKFRYYFELLTRFTGKKFEIIHAVGGGTQNRLLCQWIADAIGMRVIAGPTETTAVGNLLMQLKANDEIKNIEEGRKISLASSEVKEYIPQESEKWDEVYQKYMKITRKNK